MTTTLANPAAQKLSGKEIVDLSRKHTLYEWSAQSKVDPIPVAQRQREFISTRRKASASSTSTASSCPSTSDTATRASSRPSAEQAATLAYANPFMATEVRARLGAEARRNYSRRYRHVLLHQRRRRGQRERHQARPLLHRTPQDHRALPFLSRRNRRRDQPYRRSPQMGRGTGHSRCHPRARPLSRHRARMGIGRVFARHD